MIIFVEMNNMKKKLLPYFAIFSLLLFSSITSFGQVPSYVPTDGLVGYWPFNGNANDESGNGNDGTVNGATLTVDRNGVSGAAYSFDGIDDLIVLGNILPNLGAPNAACTFSLWFKTDIGYITSPNNVEGTLITDYKRDGACCETHYLAGLVVLNQPSKIVWRSEYPGNVSEFSYETEVANNNQWVNLTITRDGSGIQKIYINGQFSIQTAYDASIDYTLQNVPFEPDWNIGAQRWNNGSFVSDYVHHFYGVIDDIGIWSRALTEQEIQLLYTGCIIGPTAIVGEDEPLNFTASAYFCNDNPGSTFEWTVTNGVISSGQGTNSIVVLWGNEGIGTVSVVETNSEGCVGQPAIIEVSVTCTSNISQISGNNQPIILQSQTYTVNGPIESEYVWSVTNGVIASGQGTNTVNVIWAAEGEGTLSVVETTSSGCESNAVSFTANAVTTNIQELSKNRFILYPNPTTDRLIIECEASMVGQEYLIFDVLGREQKKGIITNQITTIDTSTLSNGNYLLETAGQRVKVVVAR
jgi:hypothetical protein